MADAQTAPTLQRMVPYAHGVWLAANVGGHLSLVVERFGAILDELIAGAD